MITDPPADGAWNMAVDEALIEAVRQTSVPVLRFYQWSTPTLSLGYFQKLQDRRSHVGSRNCPVVRRTTGGGAIVHDRELTYSFVWPTDLNGRLGGRRAKDPRTFYEAFHGSLSRTLAKEGLAAHVFEGTTSKDKGPEPFLCFERRASGDLVVGDAKVAGSAQRRCRGTVLQHGSVLLARSERAPELPGLADILGKPVTLDGLLAAWSEDLASELGFRLQASYLEADERSLASRLAADKFRSEGWSGRRL